jgi:hypothetical protein
MMMDKRDLRWQKLAYGKWTCPDGREVLFNRFYEPIYQRAGSIVSRADPKEWVPFVTQRWFYNDGTRDKRGAAQRALDSWLSGETPPGA